MTNRLKFTIATFLYLFLCSYFFGVVFSGNTSAFAISSGLGALALSNLIVIYVLVVVKAEEVK